MLPKQVSAAETVAVALWNEHLLKVLFLIFKKSSLCRTNDFSGYSYFDSNICMFKCSILYFLCAILKCMLSD